VKNGEKEKRGWFEREKVKKRATMRYHVKVLGPEERLGEGAKAVTFAVVLKRKRGTLARERNLTQGRFRAERGRWAEARRVGRLGRRGEGGGVSRN